MTDLQIDKLKLPMESEELKKRFKQFSLRIIKMVDSLPNTISAKTVAHQIIRSGTSPAANYRAACIAKSEKDFVNKLKMVEEELDETAHWLDIIVEAKMLPLTKMNSLIEEANELYKIIRSSILTIKRKQTICKSVNS